jgi:hypothetical protein
MNNQQHKKMNFGTFDVSAMINMQHIPTLELDDSFLKMNKNSNVSSSNSSTQSKSVPKCIDKTKTPLPTDFQPSSYSIICGNKRKFFNSPGNTRLRVLVQSFIPQFRQAEGKLEKGMIVSKVMNIVKDACPVGGFVTFENGRWWQVSERTSREKVGSLFRDFLSDKYKSSAQNKIARRKTKRAEKKQKRLSEASKSLPIPSNVASLYPVQQQQQQSSGVSLLPPMETQFQVQPLPLPFAMEPMNQHDEESSISSASCSFYDVDDLRPVQLEEL